MQNGISASKSSTTTRFNLLTRLLLGFTCLSVMSGCATDPYVTLPAPVVTHLDYDQGVAYANAARLQYQSALSKSTKDSNQLSNTLIVLGGIGVGMGFGGAHRSALGYTALIGGTAYTLGNWNSSQPRESAYLEGMKAMDCVLIAAEPLYVSSQSRQRLANSMSNFPSAMTNLNISIAAVESEADRLTKQQSKDAKRAKSAVNIVKGILNTANATYASALQLEAARENSGTAIFDTVNSVNTLVTQAIHGTIPNLSALPDVIKGLAATSDIFVPGAGIADSLSKISAGTSSSPVAPPANGQPDALLSASPDKQKKITQPKASSLDGLLAEMKTNAAILASLVQQIKLEVESSNGTQSVEKMRACGVTVDLAIHVEPAQLTFSEGKSATKYLIVSGGKKPYTAAVLDNSAPITAKSPFPSGDSKVDVIASDKTKGGDSYEVYIQDAAGKSIAIPVSIQPAAK